MSCYKSIFINQKHNSFHSSNSNDYLMGHKEEYKLPHKQFIHCIDTIYATEQEKEEALRVLNQANNDKTFKEGHFFSSKEFLFYCISSFILSVILIVCSNSFFGLFS